jgi:dihydrofolate reductase
MIRGILAHDKEWGIGKDGDLPWPKNAEDLKWFKDSTKHSAVIMGRKTWDSLPFKLPNRTNIVITSSFAEDMKRQPDQIFNVQFKQQIVNLNYEMPIWIIGGATIIEQCLDIIDELWLNEVEGSYDCDTFLDKEVITNQFYASATEHKSFGTITKWKLNEKLS